jgi:outer membrane lipoprotein-sorting protein
MNYKRLNMTLLFIVLAWWLGVGLAQAAEFSAVIINRMGSRETQGKIYMKGEKMRREFAAGEQVGITIVRPDKKVMWMLMPAQKTVMEMPFNKASLEKMMGMPKKQQTEMKLLGTEKVNGYETEKYETTVKGEGKPMKHYVWVSKKLGVPIKMVSLDGKFSMVYQDIKEGGVPDSLFEIPPGYQKMTMPRGMPGMPPPGAPRRQ